MICHLKQRLGVVHAARTVMHSFISRFSQREEDIIDIVGQKALPVQGFDTVYLGALSRQRNLLDPDNLGCDALRQHSQLYNAGIGIDIEIGFGGCSYLCNIRPILGKKFKIRLHACILPFAATPLHAVF